MSREIWKEKSRNITDWCNNKRGWNKLQTNVIIKQDEISYRILQRYKTGGKKTGWNKLQNKTVTI